MWCSHSFELIYDQPWLAIKKQRHSLPTKVHLVKAMVFPVVLCGFSIQKAKCRRIDVFELWCWRRLLRVPWTTRRSNQSILKETSPEYSLEGLMLKLKLQYFGHLMWRADSMEKTLMLRKIKGWRRRGRQNKMVGWHYRLDRHEFERAPGGGDGQGSLECCSPWGYKVRHNWAELSLCIWVLPQRRYLEDTNTLYVPGPRERSDDDRKRESQTSLWVFERLLQRHRSEVTCYGDGVCCYGAAVLGGAACGISPHGGGCH